MFVYDGSLTRSLPDQGLYVYRLDPKTYAMEVVQKSEISSPSYLAFSPDKHFLYAVSRQNNLRGKDHDLLAAYAVDNRTGELAFLNSIETPLEPGYVSVDGTGRFAAFSCTYSGHVGLASIAADGSLTGDLHVVRHEGVSVMENGHPPAWTKGCHWPRGTPFPHSIRFSPDNRFALTPDVGLNKVFVYRVVADGPRLEPNDPPWVEGAPLTDPRLPYEQSHWENPIGAGPRHLEFHPNGRWVYVVNELGSSVTLFDYDAARGALTLKQDISTLPDSFRDFSMTADIHVHPSGRFVYATNRGHYFVAAFAVDSHNGTLTPIGHAPSGGDFPRTCVISPEGKLLLVGNMLDNNVSVLAIDLDTGVLTPTGVINSVVASSCLLILPEPEPALA